MGDSAESESPRNGCARLYEASTLIRRDMYSSDQEPGHHKKPRGYEIASYILMGGGAMNLIMGLLLLLFMSRFFGRPGAPLTMPIWYFSILLISCILGLIMVIVGLILYRYAQE